MNTKVKVGSAVVGVIQNWKPGDKRIEPIHELGDVDCKNMLSGKSGIAGRIKRMEIQEGVLPGKSSYAHCKCIGCFELIIVNDIDAHEAGTNPPDDAYCEDCYKSGCHESKWCQVPPV